VFVELQTAGEKEEASSPPEFKVGDVVEIMGLADGEEELAVGIGKVMNLAGATLHGASIPEGCVSVEVLKSKKDDYVIYKTVALDDPPISTMGRAVNNFILWPTEFLKHS
jgi:hypothetical protein